MKKFKKLIYIAIFSVIFTMASYINASSVGDINGDGKINSTDMALAYERGNNDTATVHDLLRGDINNNNKLDESDIEYITNLYKSNSTLKDISLKLYINQRYNLTKSTGSGSSYQYSTSNNTVASIESNGILTGLTKGKSNIVVKSSDNKSTSVNLDVSSDKIYPSKFTLNKSHLSFDLSDSTNTSYNLICNISPSNANIGTKITWSISNSTVAKVDQNGKVTAYKNGNCIIAATNENGTKAKCSIEVNTSPTSISMNSTNQTIYLKGKNTTQLKTTYTPSNATINKDITWTSSNSSIASVDKNGLVKAVGVGTCKITAKTKNGKTSVCNIIVEKVDPKVDTAPNVSITNDKNSNVIKAGDKVVYTIKINDENVKTIDTTKISINCKGDGYSDTTLSDTRISTSSSPTNNKITKIDYTKNEITLEVQTEKGVNNVGHLNIRIAEGLAVDTNGNKSTEVVLNNYVASLNISTALQGTDGYAACVVGVGNSFYVKDYDYYLDNQPKVYDRTTNEYIYTGLKPNTEYTIKVNIEFYTGKSSDTPKRGTIEEKIKPVANEGCDIYFIDVSESATKENDKGAADAILIKTHNSGKTILIDTGYHAKNGENNTTNTRNGGDVIDQFLKENKDKENKDIVDNKTIDYLILTHPHRDHLGGYDRLVNQLHYKFNYVVVSCASLQYPNKDAVAPFSNVIADTAKEENVKNKIFNLISVTAGNCLNIDNCLFNIFNPYPLSDVPSKFLHTTETINTETTKINGELREIKGIRREIYPLTIGEIPKDNMPTFQGKHGYDQSNENNQSIVTKLICGKKKVLFMGDAGFPTEEILLGKVPKEMAKYDRNLTYSKPAYEKTVVVDKQKVTFKCIDLNKEKGPYMFGYKTSSNGENPGLGIGGSNGYRYGDKIVVTTYMNLIKDIMNNDKKLSDISDLNSKYKLSRLTGKDISADVLKKGHHGIGNTTSYSFLDAVKPDKIISTGSEKYGWFNSERETKYASLSGFVDPPADYRIRMYYNDIKHITLNKDNYINYVYGPSRSTNANWVGFSTKNGISLESIKK